MKHNHGTYYSISRKAVPASAPRSRCVCIISKKTAARAVERNRAKRRCRAAFREVTAQTPEPISLAIRIKPAAIGAPYGSLKEEIARALKGSR